MEADIQGSGIDSGFTRTLNYGQPQYPAAFNASQAIEYFGTVRGRIGYALGRTLVYGTGGLAYAGVQTNLKIASTAGYTNSLNADSIEIGYAAGGGVEYAFTPSWSLKGEYQFIDLGDETIAGVRSTGGTDSMKTDNNFHTVRLGVNYRFGGHATPLEQDIAPQGTGSGARIAEAGPAAKSEAPAAASVRKQAALANQDFAAPRSNAAAVSSGETGSAFEALRLVNGYRRSRHLQPLTLDSKLTAAASALAADMAKQNRLSHSGPNGADLVKRLEAAGYNYAVAAENVAVGQMSVAGLLAEWKKNPSERENLLLPDATEMGIAFRHRPGTTQDTFWTFVIGSPA